MDPQAFELLTRALPEPMLLLGDDGVIVRANPAAGERCGAPARELGGRRLGELVSDPPEELQRYLGLCARTRELVPGALTLRRDGGPPDLVRCDGAVLRPRAGDQPALVLLRWRPREETATQFALLNERLAALHREIAQRRRSEAALLESRESLRVTLASIGDAVIATDREGAISLLNPVAERLTGWPLAEAVGRPIDDVIPFFREGTHEPVANPCARAIATGLVVGLASHTVLRSRDGREYPVEDSAAPIKDDAGNILGAVLVFHDVTDRRRGERERELLLIAERAARAEAERANQTKDEFLATLSHELRTPLTAILMWTQVLLKQRRDGDVGRGLAAIERNARAQTRIIEDLLDMSRIVAGKLRLEPRPIDLVPLVEAAVDAVRPAAAARTIQLACATGAEPALVHGDPARLQQVLGNLLTNAIKFTPKGGHVQVELRLAGPRVGVAVRDTGVGIAREFLPHIFERFRQADSTTTRQHGGLGLGLAIVRHLVELHGGTVVAHSDGPERGAEFVVWLPRLDAAIDDPPGDDARSAAPPARDVDLGGLHLLVVDDEADVRELLCEILEARGARVTCTGSVDDALAAFAADRPDVVVSDIGMPRRDGHDLLRTIRAIPPERGGRTPAIALTAFARAEDRARALAAGYQLHLAKPVEPSELAAAIHRLAGR